MTGGDNRDRAIEHLLRQSSQRDSGDDAESCLDAETLAAWLDGSLDDRALAMTEAHVSCCARCQALVGTAVRAMPEAAGPEAALPDVAPRAPWWKPAWSAGWLVPLTAAAAAAVLWMVVPGQGPGQQPAAQNQPQARAEETQPADRPLDDRSTARSTDVFTPERAKSAASPETNERREARKEEPAPPAAPPAPSEVTANASREADGGRRADEKSTTEDRVASPAEPERAPAAQAAPAAPASVSAGASPQTLGRLRQFASATEIISPDPALRWRLRPGGTVEYSTNGGSTWDVQSTGVSGELTAGSSPAPSVCWLVGRSGVVLLTTDGRRWQRVVFPETVDLAAVQAADARTASVTTTDGRTFRTADAGQSWVRP